MFSIKAGIDISFSIAVILLKYSTYISYLYLLVGMGWDLTVLIPIALNCIINMKPLYGSWYYKSNQIKSNQTLFVRRISYKEVTQCASQ